MASRIVIPVIIVLALFVCAYVFVELVPLRIVAALQFSRLAFVLKWLGLMLLGNAAVCAATQYRVSRRAALVFALLLAAPAVFIALTGSGAFAEGCSVIAIGLAALAVLPLRNVLLRWMSALTVAGTAVAVHLAGAPGSHWARPVFTNAQANDPADRVAEFARTRTPVGAVFVTPPLLGRFRLVAYRAIVVDFKTVVFSDKGMVEWRERLVDCYGEPEGHGFSAAHAMERRYRRISDGQLLSLREKYGATYAVLFSGTPSNLPVLYDDGHFKLVTIPEPPPDVASGRVPQL
jgi:hypothetical protein